MNRIDEFYSYSYEKWVENDRIEGNIFKMKKKKKNISPHQPTIFISFHCEFSFSWKFSVFPDFHHFGNFFIFPRNVFLFVNIKLPSDLV